MLDDKKAILPDLEQGDQLVSRSRGQQVPADDPAAAAAKLENKSRTDKQQQTSPENGRKSHGPTSPAGKQKAAQNAVRDGIFSRQVVIEELGESREDFDRLKTAYFDCIQPCGALEEQFAMDFTENSYVRERGRRAEELERRNRLETFQLENQLRRGDQLEELRLRFLIQFEDYVGSWTPSCRQLPHELEEVRRELMAMSEGVDFLLGLLETIEVDFEVEGVLSAKHALFCAIRGSGHAFDVRYQIERLTAGNDSAPSSAGVPEYELKNGRPEQMSARKDDLGEEKLCSPTAELVRGGMSALIRSVAESLSDRKQKLKRIEDAETQKQISLIILDPSPTERFSRAETHRERKMYRALAGISAMKAMASPSPLSLPAPVGTEQQECALALEGEIAKRTRAVPTREPVAIATEESTIVENGPAILFEATRHPRHLRELTGAGGRAIDTTVMKSRHFAKRTRA